MYFRGTAQVFNGRGHIDFPEHFSALAVPGSVTVSLTPRSGESHGLAALEVTLSGVDVAELNYGTGSYAFDYVVYAVRQGFEDYEVYVDSKQATDGVQQALPAMGRGGADSHGGSKGTSRAAGLTARQREKQTEESHFQWDSSWHGARISQPISSAPPVTLPARFE